MIAALLAATLALIVAWYVFLFWLLVCVVAFGAVVLLWQLLFGR